MKLDYPNDEGLIVISLFDGMSCGQIALTKAGIKFKRYFASEVDKHAMKVAKNNFPDMIHIGDVTKVFVKAGFLYWEGGSSYIGNCKVLLIGGSPCQGFSFAGKQLNFDDPRSKLFFEYVRILNEIRQNGNEAEFLLENVKMKKEYQAIITEHLGVESIAINSSLVSAQSRKRIYWTNIQNVTMPTDKKIFLQDIVVKDASSVYNITEKHRIRLIKSTDVKKGFSAVNPEKAVCMTARQFANWKGTYLVEVNGRLIVPEATKKGSVEILPDEGVDLTFLKSKTRHGRRMKDKSNCFIAATRDFCWWNGETIRRLTPVECERLQTVPDNYTNHVSDSQRYRMLGNGWTVDVIAHIFKGLKK